MHSLRPLAGVAGLVLLTGLSAPALAQSGLNYKLHCHAAGFNPPQPIGDRDGHGLAASSYTCRVEGGPLDGAVATANNVQEWDGHEGTVLASVGVLRKPTAMAVWHAGEGKLSNTVTDGKVTGLKGAGRGTYRLATGQAASLSGKAFSWSLASTSPGQFVIDVKVD